MAPADWVKKDGCALTNSWLIFPEKHPDRLPGKQVFRQLLKKITLIISG
jgi:hypothetical protein